MQHSTSAQADFYDGRWEKHQYAGPLKLVRCAAILRELSRLGMTGPRIMELGCGSGWLTEILAQFGPAQGVELSPAAVSAASRRYPSARFAQADLTTWAPTGEFDVVVSHEVLEHLDDQDAHFAMARQLLRPGGALILTTPNARTIWAMPEAERVAWCNQPIENWVTRSQLRALAERHGFEVRSTRTVIPGFGRLGAYRPFNSVKVQAAFARAGLGEAFDAVRLRLGLGLHIVLTAIRA